MRNYYLFLFVAVVSFCCKKKDISGSNPGQGNQFPIPAVSPVTGSVAGVILNENDMPLQGATVTIGTNTYTTDSHGSFNTPNQTLDVYISTVTVARPGYFKAYRSFSATATKNYVTIKMIPQTLAGSFASSTAGAVSLANGTQLSFASNSIVVKSSGAAYNGTVNVYAAYIDPTNADIRSKIPGSLMGEDATNMYSLESMGMIAVEMQSSSGEALQLIATKPATLKLAIPSSLQASAPAKIATWSLDERGVWEKEGEATRNGGFYEMQVTHFSFWNCDIPLNAVYLTLHVKDQNQHPMANLYVQLDRPVPGYNSSRGGYTDSSGTVSGLVPSNEVLTMKVYSSGTCGSYQYSQPIGPFSSSTNLNITLTANPQLPLLNITGNASDCSGLSIQNGTAVITVDYSNYYTSVSNGNFTLNIVRCDTVHSVNVFVIDNTNNQQSTTATYTVSGNSVNTGTITACGTTSVQYINYTLDGTLYSLNSSMPRVTISPLSFSGWPGYYGTDSSGINNVSFYSSNSNHQLGTFPALKAGANNYGSQQDTVLTSSTVTLTAVGSAGQFDEGNFNINFKVLGTTTVHTLTGSFRVRR